MPDPAAVGAAVSAVMRVHGPDPDPATLASAIGSRLGAAQCVITLDAQRFRWVRSSDAAGRPDGAVRWAETELGRAPAITIAIAPADASPARGSFLPLALVLEAHARDLEADRLRRSAEDAIRRLADLRWRATAEMEHERRRLERNLHDGAQHHLVAVRLSMALAEHETTTAGVHGRTADLRMRLDDAERTLVDTARGVLPEALARGGLVAAFRAIDSNDLTLSVPPSRFPPTVESTVYYLALEAINNARKYAPGARIDVRVRHTTNAVEFLVQDDGPGFEMDPAGPPPRSLLMRAASVGGEIRVESARGRGTRVTGRVPRGATDGVVPRPLS